ncbi:MAG: Wzz/FepE/Etk N-terminal domain-containing protein [Candidatus Izemoplasmatales bacterium]|nr:Wzz/FepE/Etk N-terminal domain-containing protein [Candidatus Izemoplasmatales bacterium]
MQQLTKILWNNIILISIITLLVTAFGIFYTFALVSPKYTDQTSLIVQVSSAIMSMASFML